MENSTTPDGRSAGTRFGSSGKKYTYADEEDAEKAYDDVGDNAGGVRRDTRRGRCRRCDVEL
jgi:hypothetical protein